MDKGNTSGIKIRIQFTKKGAVKYIGHLDTQRFFQRLIRRAGIDVAYSQGFSPHPVMSFASPLGVGVESESEILDVTLNSLSDRDDMLNALNANTCEGISITDIRLLKENSGNAMASVAAAGYTVKLRRDDEHIDMFSFDEGRIESILSAGELNILKKTKKGESVVDIRPGIYELRYMDNDTVYMMVDASSAGNIKPETVVGALKPYDSDTVIDRYTCMITRTGIYGYDEKKQHRRLIDFGDIF